MFHTPTYTAESLHRAHKERQARMARNAVPDDGIIHPRQRRKQFGVKRCYLPEVRKPLSFKELFHEAASKHPLPAPFVPKKLAKYHIDVILERAERGEDSPYKTALKEGAIPVPFSPIFSLIIAHVCNQYEVSKSELRSNRRFAKATFARQVCMYFGRTIAEFSSTEIGEKLGGRDHATVLHAVKKIAHLRETDSDLSQLLDFLERRISSGKPPRDFELVLSS